MSVLSEKFADELGQTPKELSEQAQAYMSYYQWPGNIRELKNLIERLSVLVDGAIVTEQDLQTMLFESVLNEKNHEQDSHTSFLEARSHFEKKFIMDSLKNNNWNISKTAKSIGIEKNNLHEKLKSYDIDLKNLKL